MSTTRSQKRKNDQQENSNNVSQLLISPVLKEDVIHVAQDVQIEGPSNPKSPKIENSFLENLRISLKDEITSEVKTVLAESQKEMLSLLKSRANANSREEPEDEPENETRSFYTPTKSVRINSTQNNDSYASRNMVTGVLNGSTNHPKKATIKYQSQLASKKNARQQPEHFCNRQERWHHATYAESSNSITPDFRRKIRKIRTIRRPISQQYQNVPASH